MLFVESVTMVGMPASASFAFDGKGGLNQTLVHFPTADLALLSGPLRGIHGEAVEASGGTAARQWQDERHGTLLTVVPADRGVMLLYRPMPGR